MTKVRPVLRGLKLMSGHGVGGRRQKGKAGARQCKLDVEVAEVDEVGQEFGGCTVLSLFGRYQAVAAVQAAITPYRTWLGARKG